MSRHPSVRWAQRSDKLYITIDLPDAENVKLNLDPEGKFFFSATGGADKIPYEVDLDLYGKVDVNESKANVGLRNICYLVKKVEKKWWPRLLKQEGRPPVFLKVDWDKWVDEDEEQGVDTEFGDFDFSKLNMGGGEDFGVEAADTDEAADADEEVADVQANDENDTDKKEDVEAPTAVGEAETKA